MGRYQSVLIIVAFEITLLSVCLLGQGMERKIKAFHSFAHDLKSGEMTIKNEKQISIPNLRYDGKGPAAYFGVGTVGKDYLKERIKLTNLTFIPDENQSCTILKRYDGTKSITLTLPGNMTMMDISYLVIFCIKYSHNFGYVEIPKDLDLPKAGDDVPKLEACSGANSYFQETSFILYLSLASSLYYYFRQLF